MVHVNIGSLSGAGTTSFGILLHLFNSHFSYLIMNAETMPSLKLQKHVDGLLVSLGVFLNTSCSEILILLVEHNQVE